VDPTTVKDLFLVLTALDKDFSNLETLREKRLPAALSAKTDRAENLRGVDLPMSSVKYFKTQTGVDLP